MSIGRNVPRIEQSEWFIPIWLKLLAVSLMAGMVIVLTRALSSNQETLLGVDVETVFVITLTIFIFLMPFAIAFWFYPTSAFSMLCYWCMRFLREQIYVLSLVGAVYLFVARAPLLSLKGGISYVALLFVFAVGCFLKPTGLGDVPHPALGKLFLLVRKFLVGVESIPGWVLRVVVVLLPVAVIWFVIYFVFGSKFSNYGPYSLWNDEIGYWVWLRSFIHSGFNSGYNAPNELLSAFEFSRYGEASPFYLYIYGLPARLTGWFTAFPVLINFLLLSSSIFIFLRVVKLDNKQVIFGGLAILLTWPVLFFLPITTHETLNQAIGIMLAAIIIIMLREPEKINTWFRLAILGFVYLATLIRLSWGLMLIPVLFYCLNGSSWRRIVLAVGLGGGLYASAVILIGNFLPPINNSIFGTFSAGFAGGLQALLKLIPLQFYAMFRFKELNPNMAVVLQMLIISGWSLGWIWRRLRAKSSLVAILQSEDFFQFYSMASLLLAGLVFYIERGYYRTFAPALLMVLLLYVVKKEYKRLLAVLIINILFVYPYMRYHADIGDYWIVKADYSDTQPWDAGIANEINTWIVYDPQTQDPWCNTLLIPLYYYDSRLTLIPPGIGISYILNPETFKPPIQSRYVLFDAGTYGMYREQSNLELKAELPIGDLYINRNVSCGAVH